MSELRRSEVQEKKLGLDERAVTLAEKKFAQVTRQLTATADKLTKGKAKPADLVKLADALRQAGGMP